MFGDQYELMPVSVRPGLKNQSPTVTEMAFAVTILTRHSFTGKLLVLLGAEHPIQRL